MVFPNLGKRSYRLDAYLLGVLLVTASCTAPQTVTLPDPLPHSDVDNMKQLLRVSDVVFTGVAGERSKGARLRGPDAELTAIATTQPVEIRNVLRGNAKVGEATVSCAVWEGLPVPKGAPWDSWAPHGPALFFLHSPDATHFRCTYDLLRASYPVLCLSATSSTSDPDLGRLLSDLLLGGGSECDWSRLRVDPVYLSRSVDVAIALSGYVHTAQLLASLQERVPAELKMQVCLRRSDSLLGQDLCLDQLPRSGLPPREIENLNQHQENAKRSEQETIYWLESTPVYWVRERTLGDTAVQKDFLVMLSQHQRSARVRALAKQTLARYYSGATEGDQGGKRDNPDR